MPPPTRDRRRVLIVLNPLAARDRRAALAAVAGSAAHLELIVPDGADREAQFAAARDAVRTGVDAVVVYGGDGTVAAGFALTSGTGIPLAVVPAGTGNDFARAAGIRTRRPGRLLAEVLARLADGRSSTRGIDALRLDVRVPSAAAAGDGVGVADIRRLWAANSVNIGFDALVNQRANALRRLPATGRYLAALARELPGFRAADLRLACDGEPRRAVHAALICVQNGATIGGGIPLAPGADLADGRAEVSVVGELPRWALAGLFPFVYLRAHRLLTSLRRRQAATAEIRVPAGVPVFADGDEVLAGTEGGGDVRITVVPGAVRLLV